MALDVGRLLELGQLLRADSTAVIRADMPPAEMAAALREYKQLKGRFNMSKAIKDTEKALAALEAKQTELGNQRGAKLAELAKRKRFLGEELLDGGDVEKLTGAIDKLEREIAALEQAAAVNQKRMAATGQALRGLVKNDALERGDKLEADIHAIARDVVAAVRGLEPKADQLREMRQELTAVVAPYNNPGEPEPGGPTLYRNTVMLAQELERFLRNAAARFPEV